MPQVFIFEIFFGEIDGYRCKSSYIKGGCSRVQITSKCLDGPFSFSINVYASKGEASTELLATILGLFLASFLSMASNTPNFPVTLTKKLELQILAPLSTWKFCKTTKLCCTRCCVHRVVGYYKHKSISCRNSGEFVKWEICKSKRPKYNS